MSVATSGLIQFLGDEAKDADVKQFFVETVTDALQSATSVNPKEVKIIVSVVTDFLADYSIQVDDESKLSSICKQLLESVVDSKSSKKAPTKSTANQPKGKGKKDKKKGDEDEEEPADLKQKPAQKGGKGNAEVDDNNKNKSNKKENKTQAKGKGANDEEDEGNQDGEDDVPKGKKGKASQKGNKGKGKAAEPASDEEQEEENKGKGKGAQKAKQEKGKGKGKSKNDEEEKPADEDDEPKQKGKGGKQDKNKEKAKGKSQPAKGKSKDEEEEEEKEEKEEEEEEAEAPKGKQKGKQQPQQKGKSKEDKGKAKLVEEEEEKPEEEEENEPEEETPKGKQKGKQQLQQKGKPDKGKAQPAKGGFAALEIEDEEPEEGEEPKPQTKGKGKEDKGKVKEDKRKSKNQPPKSSFDVLETEDGENEAEEGTQKRKQQQQKGKDKGKAKPSKGAFDALAEGGEEEEKEEEENETETQPVQEEEPQAEEPLVSPKPAVKEVSKETEEDFPEGKQEEEPELEKAKSILEQLEEEKRGSDSMSKDIKVEKFDISYPGRILFKDATLQLSHGRKYGLVGPNGMGKSTLLTYIANRMNEFVNIPKHFDILYVEQEVVGDEVSALNSVIAADTERTRLFDEEKRLLESNYENAGELLAEIHSRLDQIEAYSAEARASSILTGLQFTEEMKKMPTKDFSGGWRMRIALARALFRRPTLLLLDEPTNHLDLLAVIWLETYLTKWKNTVLIVSHDQDFLNSVCTDIISIWQSKLNYYKGNYDKYKYAFGEQVSAARKAYEKQKKLIEQSKQQKKKQDQKQVQQKAKERVKVIRNKQKGKKDKDKEEEMDEKKTQLLEAIPRDYEVYFEFPDPDELSIPVIQVNDASFGYTDDKILFRDLNFGIDMESRIALVGPNGAGKSTLLKLLLGELEPTEGDIQRNRKLIVGRFTQHFVDKLNMNQTAVEYLYSNFPEYKPEELRGMLGRFGLTGQTHMRAISSLSGGQKSRVVFTEICMRNPHLLFLDEPTNHLDIESVDALGDALKEYKGGLILVSHDARLISEVCNEIWVVADETVTRFDGTFDDYRSKLVEEFEEREREEEEERKQKEEERRKKREDEIKAKAAKGVKVESTNQTTASEASTK